MSVSASTTPEGRQQRPSRDELAAGRSDANDNGNNIRFSEWRDHSHAEFLRARGFVHARASKPVERGRSGRPRSIVSTVFRRPAFCCSFSAGEVEKERQRKREEVRSSGRDVGFTCALYVHAWLYECAWLRPSITRPYYA